MENYQKKAEENLVELQEKKENARKDYKKMERIWIIAAAVLVVAHFVINSVYPENNGTGMGLVLIAILLVTLVIHFFRYYELKIKLK